MISEGLVASKNTSFYDPSRVQPGKFAEHWDVIETIATRTGQENGNGEFAFRALRHVGLYNNTV